MWRLSRACRAVRASASKDVQDWSLAMQPFEFLFHACPKTAGQRFKSTVGGTVEQLVARSQLMLQLAACGESAGSGQGNPGPIAPD